MISLEKIIFTLSARLIHESGYRLSRTSRSRSKFSAGQSQQDSVGMGMSKVYGAAPHRDLRNLARLVDPVCGAGFARP